jgi:hypothetical protein
MIEKEKGQAFDWGADASSFPSHDVDEWEFYVPSSDDAGESDVVQARVAPQLGRMIDELLAEAKQNGIPFKTRSDFVRWAAFRGLDDLRKHIKSRDEEMAHYLLLEKEAMKESQRTMLLTRVREAVRGVQRGLEVLVHDSRQDWEEARERITAFLIPISSMAGEQDFLMKMYIREFFGFKPLQDALEKISANVKLGPVIENSQMAYNRIMKESKTSD